MRREQADVGIAVASATDVARAAAGVVLTAAGLVDALPAVQISRRIYQRMLTYTINKVMRAQRQLLQECGREPTVDEVAVRAEMTPGRVREIPSW